MTWRVAARVTRGSGDSDQKMPQVIAQGCARWVWVCVDAANFHWWCGKRHDSEVDAIVHSASLNHLNQVKTGART